MGVRLSLVGDRVVADAPPGVLSAELRRRLQRHKPALVAQLGAASGDVGAPTELTAAQRRLWSLGGAGHGAHTIPFAFWCDGPFPLAAVTAALAAIQQRHAALRTAIVEREGVPQAVVAADCALPLTVVDLRRHEPAEAERRARQLLDGALQAPFTFDRPPLWRALVVAVARERTLLAFAMHHLVFDGWSKDLLLGELASAAAALAAGRAPDLPAVPWQYADFVAWQAARLRDPGVERQRHHWRQALAGAREPLQLPSDRTGDDGAPRGGANHHFAVPAALADRVAALGATVDAGPFVPFAAAFHVLLHRHTGQTDQLVCLPVAGRGRAELQPMIGFCNNLVVLRADLGGDPTLREVLQRLRRAVLSAQDHQDLPFHELAEVAGVAHLPLRRALFSYRSAQAVALRLPDVRCAAIELDRQAADFDLAFYVRREGARTVAVIRHADALFDRATVAALAERYLEVLAAVTATPDLRLSELPAWPIAPPPARQAAPPEAPPRAAVVGPRHALDRELAALWRSVLRLGRDVGIDETFAELGGGSLQVLVLIERIERQLGLRLSFASLAQLRTVRELADAIAPGEAAGGDDRRDRDLDRDTDQRLARAGLAVDIYRALLAQTAGWRGQRRDDRSLLVGRNLDGAARPLFWCLQTGDEFDRIAHHLGPEQPIWGMRSGHVVMAKTRANIAALARCYADEIVRVTATGPYALFGTCQSADIALGIARELRRTGRDVELLGLQEKFVAEPYDGRVAMFFGRDSRRNPFRYVPDPERVWRRFYRGPLETHLTPGKHTRLFREPQVATLAAHVRQALAQARSGEARPAPVGERPPPLPPAACRARVEVASRLRGRPGEPVELIAAITNTSAVPWPADDAAPSVGYRCHGHERMFVVDADHGFALPGPVAPGQTVEVAVQLALPRCPGRYRLELDLIDASGTWFGAHGSEPGVLPVRVSRLFLPARRRSHRPQRP